LVKSHKSGASTEMLDAQLEADAFGLFFNTMFPFKDLVNREIS